MSSVNRSPQWAPKVAQNKIRRLYEADARGILDTDLLDEVGWALWERCDSILTVTAAHEGHVRCPACGVMIECRDHWSAGEQIACPNCDWGLSWAAYHQTYRGKQLFGANAVDHFRTFHAAFPQAGTPQAKMLLIDQLIHAFHISLTDIGRPAAANLIEGSFRDVIRFLDSLSSSDSRAAWRRTLAAASWSGPFLEQGLSPESAQEEESLDDRQSGEELMTNDT